MAGVEGWWSGPGGGWLTTWYDMIFSLMVVTRVLLIFPTLEEMHATPGPLVMTSGGLLDKVGAAQGSDCLL